MPAGLPATQPTGSPTWWTSDSEALSFPASQKKAGVDDDGNLCSALPSNPAPSDPRHKRQGIQTLGSPRIPEFHREQTWPTNFSTSKKGGGGQTSTYLQHWSRSWVPESPASNLHKDLVDLAFLHLFFAKRLHKQPMLGNKKWWEFSET